MKNLSIHTGADLRECELPFLVKKFGKAGRFYYWIARGIDERPVRADRARRSIGAETTLLEDLMDFEAMCGVLAGVAAKVLRACSSMRPLFVAHRSVAEGCDEYQPDKPWSRCKNGATTGVRGQTSEVRRQKKAKA